ncbi:BRO-N domain-containing protein [Shouchella lonarensis]|uniref:BRO family, N-terminal domain n=1 Tax=Shouchella lonarensis TaxID=1464122 RepID=A0A1G6HTZ0_9BACI|nr:Bro-N domain-containing protein [Shouchella lonarensis]SDB96936.1 BRO family, N-terminal domain [Shouchella lonarensis]
MKDLYYGGTRVRTYIRDGKTYFMLKDVCKVLGLKHPGTVRRRLNEDNISRHVVQTEGGPQLSVFINEDGLYGILLVSRKKEAKAFRKWITSKVLPSVRKTGSFGPVSLVDALHLATNHSLSTAFYQEV